MNWEEWYRELKAIAAKNEGSVADVDAWREDFDRGLTPAEAWFEAWGE